MPQTYIVTIKRTVTQATIYYISAASPEAAAAEGLALSAHEEDWHLDTIDTDPEVSRIQTYADVPLPD